MKKAKDAHWPSGGVHIHQELPEYSYSGFDITKHITDYNLMSVIPIMESSFIYGISRYRAELSWLKIKLDEHF